MYSGGELLSSGEPQAAGSSSGVGAACDFLAQVAQVLPCPCLAGRQPAVGQAGQDRSVEPPVATPGGLLGRGGRRAPLFLARTVTKTTAPSAASWSLSQLVPCVWSVGCGLGGPARRGVATKPAPESSIQTKRQLSLLLVGNDKTHSPTLLFEMQEPLGLFNRKPV